MKRARDSFGPAGTAASLAACSALVSALLAAPVAADHHAAATARQSKPGPGAVDMFGRRSALTERLLETQLEFLAKPETAKRAAAFARNYYEALVQAGFSEAQALELVAAAGLPLKLPEE